jgi:hypothetical protein
MALAAIGPCVSPGKFVHELSDASETPGGEIESQLLHERIGELADWVVKGDVEKRGKKCLKRLSLKERNGTA